VDAVQGEVVALTAQATGVNLVSVVNLVVQVRVSSADVADVLMSVDTSEFPQSETAH
jgi:hypothetical protein